MNLILLRPDELAAAEAGSHRAVLADRRLQHLREVLRARAGDEVGVGVEGGAIGRATVVALDAHAAELQVRLSEPPPPALDVTLALALPRPPTLRKVLQQATALGVKRFALFRAERVERSYFSSHGLHATAIAEDLRLGLEQARDTIVPTVEIHPEHFGRFVRERLPALSEGRSLLVAHPGAPTPCPRAPIGPATLMVGPEGGFIPAEVAALAQVAQAIDLGPRILRVETAVVALLARLSP
ncbi:RNA methyltransferase, RsmE family [Nannocystis exedens]|uniref:Ribosomal RNA small subunit methyltransferase E n=1 Tax=Nannocystis exedens TaxID=54 RepID=A0A1I1TLB3_9BACT|nr:16S rRNA (uracil(1498)-N(3))-methyltransferase [Nannocystis exedens]PCC66564.1 16S rRNA (uracil(1498)-N(3))-methyltransferase [Nannocystis exedens]SFD57948.1 RNA methyltransferase, RsmE family [Nannocystis exedens]